MGFKKIHNLAAKNDLYLSNINAVLQKYILLRLHVHTLHNNLMNNFNDDSVIRRVFNFVIA